MKKNVITLMKYRSCVCLLFFAACFSKAEAQLSFALSPSTCINDTLPLIANSGTLSIQGYSWTSIPSGVNFSAPFSSSTNATFSTALNYTIVLSAFTGSNTFSIQNPVAVSPSPTITLAQSSLSTCIMLNPAFSKAVILSANGAISYTWSPQPFTIGGNPNGPTYTARPQTTSCFTVRGSNTIGCKASAISCITVVPRFSVNVSPTSATVCSSINLYESVTFAISTPTSGAFGTPSSFTFTWLANRPLNLGVVSLSATAIGFIPFANTTFSVEVTDSLSCVSLPATATVFAQDCTSLNELSVNNIKVYPNPTVDLIHLEFENGFVPDRVMIKDALGELIFELNRPKVIEQINLSRLSAGVYFITAKNKQGQSVFKVVKE